MNESCSVIGGSGTAKSTCAMLDVYEEVGRKAILLADFQRSSAMTLLGMLEGEYPNVIVDDLSRRDRVIPLCLLRSGNDEWESRQYREDFFDLLGRKGEESIHDAPLKLFGVESACTVFQKQDTRPPIESLRYVFKPWSPWHHYLVNNCTDIVVRELLLKLRKNMHEATRQSLYGPAERKLDAVLSDPAIALRDSDKPVDMQRIMDEKTVVMVIGGQSPEAFRMIAGAWSQEFIHFFEHGGKGKARVILEECTNYGLVGSPELRSLNTSRKTGLSWTFIMQSPSEDDDTLENMEQNCGKRIAHRCPSERTARHVAGSLLGTLEPHKVHHTTERAVFDGYEPYIVEGVTGDTESWRESERTLYRTVEDIHYQTLSDQRMQLEDEIQNRLRIGERWVNDNGNIYKERVPKPEDKYPWPGLLEAKIQKWIEEIVQTDWYVTPTGPPEMPPGWNGSGKSDRQPQDKQLPPDGSVPIRRRRSGSAGGRKKDA